MNSKGMENINTGSFLCSRCNIVFHDRDLYVHHENMHVSIDMCDQYLSMYLRMNPSNSRVVTNRIVHRYLPYPSRRGVELSPRGSLVPNVRFRSPNVPYPTRGGHVFVMGPSQEASRVNGYGNQSRNGREGRGGYNDDDDDGANCMMYECNTTRDFLSSLEMPLHDSEGSTSRDASDEHGLDLELHL